MNYNKLFLILTIIHKILKRLKTPVRQHRIDSNYTANASELINTKIIFNHGQM